VKEAHPVNVSRNGIQQIHLYDLHVDDEQNVGEQISITSCAGFSLLLKMFLKRCCKLLQMRISDTYHLYVQCVAMIPESAAFEEIFRDYNVHEAAGLTYLLINHRRGYCLGGFLKKSSGNTRTTASIEIII